MVERQLRPRFKVTRTISYIANGARESFAQTKWFGTAAAAYRWVAFGLLFRMRDKALGGTYRRGDPNCPLCRELWRKHQDAYGFDADPPPCKWHDEEWFSRTSSRIARLLRHYNEKETKP